MELRYVCRGPRVLPDRTYSKVVSLIADGKYDEAAEHLRHFGLAPSVISFDSLMAAADTRQGCGVDLTDLIRSVSSDTTMPCPCGKISLTVLYGESTARQGQHEPWWRIVLSWFGLTRNN